ncbi:MAG: HAMP domain-containing sensor histidine kinase [Pseudomonadota bacterium]
MKSLYLRIYLTVVAALALFAIGSAWLFQSQVQVERGRVEAQIGERIAAWGELIQRSLPAADAPPEQQASALGDWSQRLRLPLALDDATGQRIGTSESFERRAAEVPGALPGMAVPLDDGRTLWVLRVPRQGMRDGAGGLRGGPRNPPPYMPFLPPGLRGVGLAAILVLLFAAVAAGAYPVVRRLTRRLESLKNGVERFGAGALGQRVDATGRDEVAAVAASFNQAAERIETLVRSHQSLLANASHELRSPLARLKMAVSMLEDAPEGAPRERLKNEIRTNIGELDALVEEVLLASRLDAQQASPVVARVDLIGIAAEEAARVGAELQATQAALVVPGDERLLRRALRNLLENARRYGVGAGEGGDEITLVAERMPGSRSMVELRVCDRGPGVPEALRERIFEPFFRLPGHAEREGGVGLGLALVKQIAERHRGRVRCEARDGGGTCFVLSLPLTAT